MQSVPSQKQTCTYKLPSQQQTCHHHTNRQLFQVSPNVILSPRFKVGLFQPDTTSTYEKTGTDAEPKRRKIK